MSRNDESLVIKNSDLSAAVAAHILDEATAQKLVNFVSIRSLSGDSEDERVRLITGFNDIFVAIGLALFFSGITFFARDYSFAILPIAAWLLAEVFTRKMRMALPSIILLLVFAGSVMWAGTYLMLPTSSTTGSWPDVKPTGLLLAALATVAASALHWWRFHVPITVAAGVAALVATLMAALAAVSPDFVTHYGAWVLFPVGLGVFALAMSFDRQDRMRRTQKSDRAFWLHLLAAPLIVHPLVWNLQWEGDRTMQSAILVFALFTLLSFVALIIDRRAVLVSSLTYLGYALSTVIGRGSYGEIGIGISIFLVGLIVLVLSVAWKPLRRLIVDRLPLAIQNQIPVAA